ncbi:orotidine-5'-phosphate decarboxylase [Dehalogenimonas alkenigignens]|uniref:Orotidine 5'-phosphate decarboxylase n=1 Tax=Dehalogenimonas alkenigignens TaxID=1217799 RepID=A0A0W0GGI5_9CHLR|nr:orotidine-5'-phosphate decarboxylase [Dehalogenimonas alkenigignens]KTB47674.1 orotidine-5'-phosphate decarboxylase [Dehalogenimonas alkenigignens]PVV84057.1 orotidine-5'-phosphate decarboxylase [Dehalogenimonas alkenigignens]
MNCLTKLNGAARHNRSCLCIGLDPEPEKLPAGASVTDFCREIIGATYDLVCAYKPNIAFFEALGSSGWSVLKDVIEAVPRNIPVILDAKRGDIGNTARAYARAAFDELGADAVTVNPYLGRDSIEPFFEYRDKAVFVLCRTSNPGAADFQSIESNGKPLYQIVADKVETWNRYGNLGLVAGATQPSELKAIRDAHPTLPLLIPGVGAQGGSLELAVKYGSSGGGLAVISVSRQVIYASSGTDYSQAARAAALLLRDEINQYLAA